MPRRSQNQITRQLALKIADKLKAVKESRKGSPHDLYAVYENGVPIVVFHIRHGSKKNLGHDHIPDQIHVNAFKSKQLANCPMSRAQWVQEMKSKGVIESDDGETR
jgi:hypothetical protein